LSSIDGLIIPGGESTTFLKILHFSQLYTPLLEKIKAGLPVMATCAGLILLSTHIDNVEQESMKLLPISVSRNGYGRQIESFCYDASIVGFDRPYRAVFIRAPIITKVDSSVSILARDTKANPIMVKKDKILGLTFHPELTDDTRLHEMFIDLIDKI
jgi:5'-phosphate synthase pdxT subunit